MSHRIANKCQIFSYHCRMGLVRHVNSSTALVVKGSQGYTYMAGCLIAVNEHDSYPVHPHAFEEPV
jgi:hypothetical protein